MEKDMLSSRTESGKNTYYVSDSTELFEENAKHLSLIHILLIFFTEYAYSYVLTCTVRKNNCTSYLLLSMS